LSGSKHVSAAKDTDATIEDAMFYMRSVPRLYSYDEGSRVISLVEAGSNTSTVAPRVVGGVEKGTLFLGGYKYGDLALQVGGVSNFRR
jgi:hypothetical protein